jgi:uncharacterized protein YeaC (DUF1315 family)
MDIIQLVENLSDDIYQRLKHAAETGRWPEGTPVDQAQRDSALQIVMAYQAKRLNSDQNMTIGADGQIVQKTKRELKAQFTNVSRNELDNSTSDANNSNNIARFSNL